MRVDEIFWLDDIVEKLWRKHRVEPYEVKEVLDSRSLFRFVEKGSRKDEDLYLALGQTDGGRHLAVFFVFKAGNMALIVSARDMAPRERRQYERR